MKLFLKIWRQKNSQSKGRIESILSSLPADVKWQYKKDKEYKVLENKLLDVINKDWNV